MIPEGFNYIGHLDRHCPCDWRNFEDSPVYPRQLHFYLPTDGEPCNFRCFYCCGVLSTKKQVHWENTGLRLIEKLGGDIPFHAYSGAFTEPTLCSRLPEFIQMTKRYGSNYGLKTNGSMMTRIADTLIDWSDSDEDFVSVSLDAGSAESHSRTKGVPESVYYDVIKGIKLLTELRGDISYPKIRVSYLLNKFNSSEYEINKAIEMAVGFGIDSLRFSHYHPPYGAKGKQASAIWQRAERENYRFKELFGAMNINSDTTVFYVEPTKQPRFRKCAYGYYQITLANDGYVYRCTTAADEIFQELRLGQITDDIDEFNSMIMANQSAEFNPQICARLGVYCCRAAVAINSQIEDDNV